MEDYPCTVDGAPASIGVNLRFEAAMPATHDTRYTVAILMRDAGEHGLGSDTEALELGLVEEGLMPRAHALGLLYVGRLRTRSVWEVTFYGPRGHLTSLRTHALALAGDRRVAAIMNPEAGWTYYRELLLPDPERRRWLEDRRIVDELREQGELTPRRVEHRLAFAELAGRDAFATAVFALGFAVELDELAVRVRRVERLELEHLHAVVMILVDVAHRHGGRYECWDAPAIGP